jgi:hypothetical protein
MKSFSELTGKEKLIELLRWLCIPPAAMLGFVVAYYGGGFCLPLAEFVGIVNPPSDMGFNRMLRYVIWLFPMGAAYVVAGALAAPRWRMLPALVLAVLWILWTGRIHGWSRESVVGAAVAAMSGAAFVFWSEGRRKRQPTSDK